MKKEITKETTSIILHSDMIETLDTLARNNHTDRSSIIRQLILYSLKHHPYLAINIEDVIREVKAI